MRQCATASACALVPLLACHLGGPLPTPRRSRPFWSEGLPEAPRGKRLARAAAAIPAAVGIRGSTAPGPHPGTARKGIAYVINSGGGTVTPINLTTNTPGKPIKIGHGWDSGFEAIVVAP